MLDEIFMGILDMTRTASLVILAVALARLLLRRAPKAISYGLWALVLFRLLCPVALEAPVSILPERSKVSQDYTLADEPISLAGAGEAAWRAVGDAANGGLGIQHIRTTKRDEAGRIQYVTGSWWEVGILAGQYVWLAGICGMLLYSAFSYRKIRGRLAVAVPLRENILVADHIETPFVMGIFAPKIYLPCNLGEREQEYIIFHERYHIRRLDHLVKGLAFLALSLHWFNPLAWLAFALMSQDMEMSCDEAVVRRMGVGIRADYSASLLAFATGHRILAGAPLAFGEGDTKARIRNLARWKKPAWWAVAAGVLAVSVLAVCLLTNPQRSRFGIRITIPAGSKGGVYYSDEEISPKRGRVTFAVGQDVGDTQISLEPVEVGRENAYDEAPYVTPGMPVEMEAEKGAWFRVGIYMENPGDEDKDVYVTVWPVEVRIASKAETMGDGGTDMPGDF